MAATHYRNRFGELEPIAEMHPNRVENTMRKLEREEPHRTEEIEAMRADQLVRPSIPRT